MRRSPLRLLTFLVCAVLATSCLGPDAPTGVRDDGRAALRISPALIPSPADATALPINRIRTVAARVSDGAVLAESTTDVDSGAPGWTPPERRTACSTPTSAYRQAPP